MSKEDAKKEVEQLLQEYKAVKTDGTARQYSEEDTAKQFILPFFNALGWDIVRRDEVSAQDHIKGSGRSDYNFKINGVTQFFLEAKKLSTDLDNEEHAKQAINYSWNRGITYAILTNFEAIKVFNAQRVEKAELLDKLVFEIPCGEYISDFETLWLLSRESFTERRLDAFSEKHGKKEKSVSVATVVKKLNEDIQWARGRLTESFEVCNEKKHLSRDLIDEGVQKLLDRLLFLRVAEDRGVEPNILRNLLREAEQIKNKNETTPFQAMVATFRELHGVYDSDLFSRHTFEEWEK